MRDLQQYSYYDPNPRPASGGDGRSRILKVVGLIVFSSAVLALIAVLVINVLKDRGFSLDGNLASQADDLERELASECESSDQNCLMLAQADAARQLGFVKACDDLPEAERADCVNLIAIDQGDPDICALLSGAAKDECAAVPLLLKARETLDLRLCAEIAVLSLRGSCHFQVEESIVAAGTCAESGIDVQRCADFASLQNAVATGNPESCATLDVSVQEECVDLQDRLDADEDGLMLVDERTAGTLDTVADSDADGLLDGEEVNIYGTNPLNADSDGDGFSDKIEIDGGYDPLK